MYQESLSVQEQINSLSEELRITRMQLNELYRHLQISVNAKREITGYKIASYANNTALNKPIGNETGCMNTVSGLQGIA